MSNSKDDALTEGEFERLWEAAGEDELDRIIFAVLSVLFCPAMVGKVRLGFFRL